MNIVFMGTPEFALPTLSLLIKTGYPPSAVITQPDRPKGRGYKLTPPPVKEMALINNIPVFQPEVLKALDFLDKIEEMNPDLIVVVAYGKILPKEIICLPKLGCINLHPSLLPKYRGAAPIHWAIINGEKRTGVTTMYLSEEMDAGDIILQKEVEISNEDTAGTLSEKLAKEGSHLLQETIKLIETNTAPRYVQDHSQVSFAPPINKEIAEINWNNQAKNIHNQVRGLNPKPGAYTFYQDKLLKIWKTKITSIPIEREKFVNMPAGTIILEQNSFIIKCGDGMLKILEVQPEGKKRMKADEFLRGYPVKIGEILGGGFD